MQTPAPTVLWSQRGCGQRDAKPCGNSVYTLAKGPRVDHVGSFIWTLTVGWTAFPSTDYCLLLHYVYIWAIMHGGTIFPSTAILIKVSNCNGDLVVHKITNRIYPLSLGTDNGRSQLYVKPRKPVAEGDYLRTAASTPHGG